MFLKLQLVFVKLSAAQHTICQSCTLYLTDLVYPGLFYKHLCHWLTDWLTDSAFSSKPSNHPYTQTARARELKFWENGHPPPRVTCHLSGVRCHVSGVTCHVSPVTFYFLFFFKVVELVDGRSVINGTTPSSYWVVCCATEDFPMLQLVFSKLSSCYRKIWREKKYT